jgi:predicted HTH domain antitoxin
MQLAIPDTVIRALRLPEAESAERLRTELAVALYARGLLSFGRARELASIGRFEFGRLLGSRGVSRHYTDEELADDVAYGRRQ